MEVTTTREGESRQLRTTRRDFVAGVGAAAIGGTLPWFGSVRNAAGRDLSDAPIGIRFVFFSDPHLRDEYRSAEGLASALRAIERLDPKPSFILTGGDLCQNLRDLDLEAARARGRKFTEIWGENTSIRTYHLLGNHDAAGWGDGAIPTDHPDYAFGLMRRLLGMERNYYSFDHGGWHFAVVDNVHLTEPGSHIGYVDSEQLEWLREDLSNTAGRPTMIAMHVPPLTSVEFLTSRPDRDLDDGEWRIGFDRLSRNPDELLDACSAGNVRAILSGHIHLLERLELKGHTFLGLGSVSGQQWMGPRKGMDTPEGFAVLDLRPDGSFDYSYETFGWDASPEAIRAQGE